jgi:hypothetical protein
MRIAFSSVCLLLSAAVVHASQPQPSPEGPVSADELKDLGIQLRRLPQLNNVLLRADTTNELRETASGFEARKTSIDISVTRVTEREVMFEILGRPITRIALRHAFAPNFGNLQTVYYSGGPATQKSHMLSTKLALRIGEEIDLEVARTLRHGDHLIVTGTIEQVIVNGEGWFTPHAIAVVGDWTIKVEE